MTARSALRSMPFEVLLPIRTRNWSNNSQGVSRGAMFARAKEKAQQRDLTRLVLAPHVKKLRALLVGGVKVTLVRVAPSNGLDPDDNLRTALKWIKDGIAKTLGVDDRDPIISWNYDQRRGDYGVLVRIESRRDSHG